MLNNEQYYAKLQKVKLVVETFLSSDKTIYQIAIETGISKSSVQRYLNDYDSIRIIYGGNAVLIMQEISRKLQENYNNGVKLGGNNYALNNDCLKDDLGHFIGSIRK